MPHFESPPGTRSKIFRKKNKAKIQLNENDANWDSFSSIEAVVKIFNARWKFCTVFSSDSAVGKSDTVGILWLCVFYLIWVFVFCGSNKKISITKILFITFGGF